MPEHIQMTPRVQVGVLSTYIERKIETYLRKSVVLDLCRERGGILYGQGGPDFKWFPRFRRKRIVAGTGYPKITFAPPLPKRPATIPFREFHLGQTVPLMDTLATQNAGQNVEKQIQKTTEELTGDFMADLPTKFFSDGHIAGSTNLHGFESMYAYDGLIANSPCADPDDQYANLYTNLAYYGGAWTPNTGGGWPTGSGDTQYCAWSPIIVDYNNPLFGGATANWTAQWQAAIRFALGYTELLTSSSPDVLLLNAELLMDAKNSLDPKQQVLITSQSSGADVGYKTLEFEGLKLVTEYGPMDLVGYFVNFDKLQIRSMTKKNLVEMKTDSDITTLADLTALYAVLNLWFEAPVFFPKLMPISTEGT